MRPAQPGTPEAEATAAAELFLTSLDELVSVLDLDTGTSLADELMSLLRRIRVREAPQRGVLRDRVRYEQHGIGFVLRWPGRLVDVDVDGRRLVIDPWKVSHCGKELGCSAGSSEVEGALAGLAKSGMCARQGDRYVWPAAGR